jgi:hypothetical protein
MLFLASWLITCRTGAQSQSPHRGQNASRRDRILERQTNTLSERRTECRSLLFGGPFRSMV